MWSVQRGWVSNWGKARYVDMIGLCGAEGVVALRLWGLMQCSYR